MICVLLVGLVLASISWPLYWECYAVCAKMLDAIKDCDMTSSMLVVHSHVFAGIMVSLGRVVK